MQMKPIAAENVEGIAQASIAEKPQRDWGWRPSSTQWSLVLMLGDGLLVLAALASLLILAPYLDLTFHITWNDPGTWRLKIIWGGIALLSWSIAASITQAQDLRNASNRFKSPFRALFALVLMIIFWMILIYPFIADRFSLCIIVSLLFLVVAIPTLTIWRITLAEFMRLPHFRTRAVIIGITTAGATIAREVHALRRPGIRLLGFISENTGEKMQKDDPPVLGGRNTLQDLMHNRMLDMIIMATDYKAEPALFQDAIEATQFGISLVPMPVAYESIGGKIPVEHVGDQWYLALPVEIIVSPLYLCWRKIMDLFFGFLGTLSLLLILPILAALIILDSPGRVFYKQERLGRNGRKFFIYKFRSMYTDAEHAGKAIWTTEGDTRITRIGRVLRVTHLDELPQVFNILRGDMSLIGPRPEREAFATDLEKTIPFYRCRLMVKPGLTGWAQVKYPYGGTNAGTLAKLQYDLYYIKHQSFTLDIWIILKTVAEVLFCRGT
jgi:exopolysaccharide biosynthesis polyprenyl glycosylphosphotransferase